MRRFRFRASVILPVVVLVVAAAGGVVAGTQSSDEQALRSARPGADGQVERRVQALLSKMTLQEKLEQIQLLPDFMVTEEEVRQGLGSVLSGIQDNCKLIGSEIHDAAAVGVVGLAMTGGAMLGRVYFTMRGIRRILVAAGMWFADRP